MLHRTGNDGCPSLCPGVPCPAAPAMVLALDGSQSQLVASTQSKAPALKLAASSSCTLGHSSDTAQTQSDTPQTQLDTAHHDLTKACRRVQHLPQPWSEGLGCRAVGRPGSGSSQGASMGWHHAASESLHAAPYTPLAQPGAKGLLTWPKHHHLGWPTPGRLLHTDIETAQKLKKPWVLSKFETFCWGPGGWPRQLLQAGGTGGSQGGSLGSAALAPSNNNTTAQSLSHFYLHHCTAHFPRMHWNVVGQTRIAHIHELNISGKEDKTQRVTTGSCGGTCNNCNYWQ